MESALNRNELVVDTISGWLEEHNAVFLAKENEVVYWTSITDDAGDGEWHRMTAAETARILKATCMHSSVMAQCTPDAVITAAQETGRAYVQGVKSNRKVRPEYFNYLEHEKIVKCDRYHIAEKIIKAFEVEQVNPSYTMVVDMIEEAWKRAELPKISPVVRNRMVREVCDTLSYKVCRYGQRYNCPENGKTSVLKLEAVRYATVTWPECLKELYIENALKG